jgi:hypothetical protein
MSKKQKKQRKQAPQNRLREAQRVVEELYDGPSGCLVERTRELILSAQEGVNWVRGRISNPFWRALATKLVVDRATAPGIASVLAEALARGPVYDSRMPWMPPLINDVVLTEEGRRLWNAEAEEIRRIRAKQAKESAEPTP